MVFELLLLCCDDQVLGVIASLIAQTFDDYGTGRDRLQRMIANTLDIRPLSSNLHIENETFVMPVRLFTVHGIRSP